MDVMRRQRCKHQRPSSQAGSGAVTATVVATVVAIIVATVVATAVATAVATVVAALAGVGVHGSRGPGVNVCQERAISPRSNLGTQARLSRRVAPTTGHAVAIVVHRLVQRCPCAVSSPPTQAGSLAIHSRHARSRDRKRLCSNSCRRDTGLLEERLEVHLQLILPHRQRDAVDVVPRISVLLHAC